MTWLEFAKVCGDRVREIRGSKDDGHYAKSYARDVEHLLLMLGKIEHHNAIEVDGFSLVEQVHKEVSAQ
jgi:hypothetical protein